MVKEKGAHMRLMGFLRLDKRGQEASSWHHLGGWIIALAVLIVVLGIILSAFGVIDIDFIRNLRFG